MHITSLSMQAAGLQKTATESLWHLWETLSQVTIPQNLMEAAEKYEFVVTKINYSWTFCRWYCIIVLFTT